MTTETKTKERPILFSGPMIRAILAGEKTQTRRVVKPQPEVYTHRLGHESMRWRDKIDTPLNVGRERLLDFCPYGQPGDRLWVRETWRLVPVTAYGASTGVAQTINPGDPDEAAVYAADWDRSGNHYWRPSIHMPRWASRITLEVMSVRVAQVHDISDDEALAEGVMAWAAAHCSRRPQDELMPWAYFELLWNSINDSRGYGWNANPWVWVVEFRRVTP